jgi:ectoine hydroxylase-related dioxygenase (phytanoyl-CoA dioxygenase family)
MKMEIEMNFEDISNIKSILDHYGVCVVKNVLDEKECNDIVMGMASSFSHITSNMEIPFNVSDIKTWKTLDSLFPVRNMLYQHWGLGMDQYVWDVRCNPKIISVFEKLYDTKDLLVSFDGIGFGLPPELSGKGWFKENWYHIDQSPLKSGKQCIQSWVNGFDTNEGDATLVCLVYSHHFHEELKVLFPDIKDDWCPIKDTSFYKSRGCIELRIRCPKGSLVLWDSRLVHYGGQVLRDRKNINFRAVIYLCYTPRSLITEANRKKKIETFHKRGKLGSKRTTNHWPHRGKMFPETPRLWNNPIPNINPLPDPYIKDEFKYLIGY